MYFRNLHRQKSPLLLANVWDVASAQTAEQLEFQALGTSSAAMARMLGYEDGEAMPFSELEYLVQRISLNTSLPLSVDLESGYSRDANVIADHIQSLATLGVQGINIEDSIVEGQRILLDENAFADTLAQVKKQLTQAGIDVFINVRSDTFLLGIPEVIEATQKRIRCYEAAGADGIFLPCITQADHIEAMVQSTDLPINVMAMPQLYGFKQLQALGIKRISMGNFLFDKMQQNLNQELATISNQQSFKSIF